MPLKPVYLLPLMSLNKNLLVLIKKFKKIEQSMRRRLSILEALILLVRIKIFKNPVNRINSPKIKRVS